MNDSSHLAGAVAEKSKHTPGQKIEVEMEPDQTEVLMPIFDEAREAAAAGQRGIVFGQLFEDRAKVLFIAEPWSSEIQAVLARRANAMRAAKKAEAL